MRIEQIEQRLRDIHNQIYFLDSLTDAHDDTNIHEIEEQIDVLLIEERDLTFLLESCFDDLIGL